MNGANTLWYRRPAACFNEALPLGNGRLGACVYGGVKAARFSLNEDTLWSGYPRSSQESCAAVYRQARQLALELENLGEEWQVHWACDMPSGLKQLRSGAVEMLILSVRS